MWVCPESAYGQRLLVGNTSAVNHAAGSSTADLAQAFTTGPNSGGYKLTSVEILLGAVIGPSVTYDVSINTNSSGEPGTSLGSLTGTALTAGTLNEFTTTGIDLDASTTYFVVFAPSANGASPAVTYSNSEDSGSADGWSIANDSLGRTRNPVGAWVAVGGSLQIRINGHVVPTPLGVLLDTTLTVADSAGSSRGCSSTSNAGCHEQMVDDTFTSADANGALRTFEVDGLSLYSSPTGNLNFWVAGGLRSSWLREYELEHLVLVLDGTRFRFSDADAGGYKTRQWRGTALSWSNGDVVQVQIVDGRLSGMGQGQQAQPLTAVFENTPQTHDGASPFTFRIVFSEAVAIEPAAMRDHALTVSGGTVTDAVAVDGATDVWALTVEPSGDHAVSILLPVPDDCADAGAVCTTDGRKLSAGLARVIPMAAPGAQQQANALTASFEDEPSEHDGSEFWVRIRFSAPIKISFRVLRDEALSATGGAVTRARRIDGDSALWEILVEPSGSAGVTVSLPASVPCGEANAICTEDGRALTGSISTTIQGPPGLSVADAEVEEGPNAALSFAVTLDRPASGPVSVDWATSDGTATAGSDYTAASGTLSFAAGESAKTVSVTVLDDAHDDAGETLTLRLSNATGAHLTDDTATGTITNSDPLPRGFMARFGRTAAVQMVEHVQERMEASREPGFRGRIAGRELRRGMERELAMNFLHQLGTGGGAHSSMSGAAESGGMYGTTADPRGMYGTPGLAGGGAVMASSAGRFGQTRAAGGAGPMGAAGPMSAGADGFNGRGLLMGLGHGDVLTGSDFALNRETRGGVLSFWSRGARSQFAGREGDLSLGGDVRTTMFGADYAKGQLVAGLSLSNSRGLGEYGGVAGGQVASAVTGLYPWLGYKVSDRVSVWGVAGYGAGGLLLTPESGPALESGLSMAMAAAGTRGELVAGGAGGFALAFKADALWVGTAIDGVDGAVGRLAATAAAATRFRTGLEGSRDYTLAGRLSLRPIVEVGLRHDGGDAETGAGMDVGAGLVVSDWSTGLAVDVRVRTLLVHEAEGFRERGMAVSLSYNPTPSTPLGLVARVAPSWGGQATSGAQALWGRETMAGMAHGGLAQGNRLDGEVGYGLPVGSRFVGTPRFGVGTSEYGRDYRVGYGLGVLDRESLNFEMGVDAQRRESPMQGGASNGVLGRATLGW